MPRTKSSHDPANEDQLSDAHVYLLCEWNECQHRVPLRDFLDFRSHIEHHIRGILPDYHNRRSTESIPEDFTCLWGSCAWDTPEDANELIRHVLFHTFHTKLKALGTKRQVVDKLSECSLDPQGQNLIPDFPKPFLCEWDSCELEINCPYWFYQHVESHVMAVDKQRIENDDTGIEQVSVACGWTGCTFVTKNHYKLKEHCRTHTHEKVYACSVCGGMFASMSKLIDHLTRQNPSEYQSFQCSHCLKHCGSQRILRDHMRHHVNNIKCKFCDMTCPNPSALKQHMKFRHSDDRPYECDLCDASWKTLSDLRRHRESHNSVLSFVCSVEGCNFSARAVQTLKRHIKVEHQGEELSKYECHLCATRYTRGTGLTHHLKTKHKFRWPSGHPRFRYKEHEDGIWRLQTVRFESLQLSQQFNNESQSDNQEELIPEGTCEEEQSSQVDAGHLQYQTIDSPVAASLSSTQNGYSTRDTTTDSTDNIQEDKDNNRSNPSQADRTTNDGIRYIVLPYSENRIQIHNHVNINILQGDRENPIEGDGGGPSRKKRATTRKQPYERPSSPSLEVPEALLALQEVATRLAATHQ